MELKNIFSVFSIIVAILILLSISTYASQNFLKLTESNEIYCRQPMIEINKNNIHIVWIKDFYPGSGIYYRVSRDYGNTWASSKKLTYNERAYEFPCIGVYENTIHIVWCDSRNSNREIYYKVSRDAGETWSNDIRLTNYSMDSMDPWISVYKNQLLVVWRDYRNGHGSEIYYKISSDSGHNWGNDTRLTYNPAPSYNPVAAFRDSNIYVIWQDDRGGKGQKFSAIWGLYYKVSRDAGETWSNETRLTPSYCNAQYPTLSMSNRTLHLAWVDNRDGNEEIYYKVSRDAGETWSNDIRLTYDNGSSLDPFIYSKGRLVCIAWVDNRDGNEEIYYKVSRDAGETWSNDIRLTYTENDTISPSLAIDEKNNIHFVWSENYGIYYKKVKIITPKIYLSSNKATTPAKIKINITCDEIPFNSSTAKCELQYKSQHSSWRSLKTVWVKNYWYSIFILNKSSIYTFRVRVTDIENGCYESGWIESPIKLEIHSKRGDIIFPGFNLILLMISIFIAYLIIKCYKRLY